MAPKLPLIPILILLISSNAQIDVATSSLHLTNETVKWQFEAHSNEITIEDEDDDSELHRRSLYWHAPPPKKYYISYGALSANRIPCPPRSGRSYYTHNCYRASGPVHPYTRGCSAITRCRR